MTLTARELDLLGNTDVLGYIQAKNAARNAQAEAEGWLFWTNMAEDRAEEYANVYELELCTARAEYCEWHKEVWGCKIMPFDDMTLEEVWAANARMAQTAKEQWEAEEAELAELERIEREEVAMGLRPNGGYELEEWEVFEAAAEELGYGA